MGISAVTFASRRLAFINIIQWTHIFRIFGFIVACTACRLFSNVCRTPVPDSMKALTRYTLYRFASSSSSRFSRPSRHLHQNSVLRQEVIHPRQILAIPPLGVVLFTEPTIPKDFLIVKSNSPFVDAMQYFHLSSHVLIKSPKTCFPCRFYVHPSSPNVLFAESTSLLKNPPIVVKPLDPQLLSSSRSAFTPLW